MIKFIIKQEKKDVCFVPKEHAVVVELLGKYSRTLREGIHLIVPFLESTRHINKIGNKKEITDKIYLGEQKLILKNKEVNKKDGVCINLNITLSFQVINPETYVLFDNIQYDIEQFVFIFIKNKLSNLNKCDILSIIDRFNNGEFKNLSIDAQTDLLHNTSSDERFVISHIISLHEYFKQTVFGIRINKTEINIQ